MLLPTYDQTWFRRSCLSALIPFLLLLCQCSQLGSQSLAPPTATREVVDDVGRRVSVASEVKRVVSLAPNLTEIVYAVDAGEALVGDTSYCDYPAEAKSVAKVGDTLHPSIERIIAQTPSVRICRIDEDGCVWYETSIIGPDGTEEEHTLIVYEDDTWEPIGKTDG